MSDERLSSSEYTFMIVFTENVSPWPALESILLIEENWLLFNKISGKISGENWIVISRTSGSTQLPCSTLLPSVLKLIAGDQCQLIRADLLDTVPDDAADSLAILYEVELIVPMRVQGEKELGLVTLHDIQAIFVCNGCDFFQYGISRHARI